MRSAIRTKYHGPTSTRGARISARGEGLPIKFYPWTYEKSVEDNHRQAAQVYASELEWPFEHYRGGWYGDLCYWVDIRS